MLIEAGLAGMQQPDYRAVQNMKGGGKISSKNVCVDHFLKTQNTSFRVAAVYAKRLLYIRNLKAAHKYIFSVKRFISVLRKSIG